MKIRLSMQEASIAIDFEEERAFEVFSKLNEMLLNLKRRNTVKELKEQVHSAVTHEERPMQTVCKADAEETVVEECRQIVKYKGFLYIRCPECGAVKGLHMKKESDHYHCHNCGARSVFKQPLVALFVNCECGGSFRYLTNLTDELFDINCLDCGNLVAVKWNANKQVYETIR